MTIVGQQNSKRQRRLGKDRQAARRGAVRSPVLAVPGCPTPTKRRFSSREAAEQNSNGKRAYRCRCREWHLTTKGTS